MIQTSISAAVGRGRRVLAWLCLSGISVHGLTPDPAWAQLELPGIPPDLLEPGRLSGLSSIEVSAFAFHGNTVFSDAELAAVVAGYAGRALTREQLEDAREALSTHYLEHGYISSGAVLPDQEVKQGVVNFDIVEGRVSEVQVSGLERLRETYVRSRLEPPSPFRIQDLRERIEQLQRGPLVERIDASIEPGERPGQTRLRANVRETPRPYQIEARISNHVSPNIGGLQFEVSAEHRNLTGMGDRVHGRLGFSRGAAEFGLGGSLPLNRHDTTLAMSFDRSNSAVVSEPFNTLDIESLLEVSRLEISHPLFRSRPRDVDLSLALEVRRNQTSILGIPFSFSPGARDGRTSVTVLSATQSWTERREGRVLAFSSSFKLGLDWLGASVGRGVPDGRYFLWFGQGQWFQRLPVLDSRLLLRANVQLANDALLSSEKFALGGYSTVRGYRENQLTRDNVVHASLEWRIPIARAPFPGAGNDPDDGVIALVPFLDYGRGWENEVDTPEPGHLASVGAGILWRLSSHAELGVFWGHRLRNVERSGERDLQDSGIHFHFVATAF